MDGIGGILYRKWTGGAAASASQREPRGWGPAYARKMLETDGRRGMAGREALRHFRGPAAKWGQPGGVSCCLSGAFRDLKPL